MAGRKPYWERRVMMKNWSGWFYLVSLSIVKGGERDTFLNMM
jgi:hypothetical protein